MRNVHIAAAVAAALGTSVAVHAVAPPTPAQAMGATHSVFLAGSSAAANGVVAFIENTVCAPNGWALFTTPTTTPGLPDFRAVSCTAQASSPVFPNATVTVWYRPEGGSVVGVFPVKNNTSIKQLNISAAGCT